MEDTRIVDYKDIPAMASRLRGKSIVLVGGCFDVLHIGHLVFLTQAKRLGEALIVVLESDEFIRKIKHKEPVHSLAQRTMILSELRCIDCIVTLPGILQNRDYEKITRTLRPSIIAVTKGDHKLTLKQNQAKNIGGVVVEIDHIPGFSSSSVSKNLQAQIGKK